MCALPSAGSGSGTGVEKIPDRILQKSLIPNFNLTNRETTVILPTQLFRKPTSELKHFRNAELRIRGKLLWEEVAAFVAQEVPAFVMAGLGLIHLLLQSSSMLELAPFTLHYAYRQVWRRSGFQSFTIAEVGNFRGSILRREFLKKLSLAGFACYS
jgi:hypothetical protein